MSRIANPGFLYDLKEEVTKGGKMQLWYILLAAFLCALRVLGQRSQFFQAIAIFYVGALAGCWLESRKTLAMVLGVGMVVVEVACWIWS